MNNKIYNVCIIGSGPAGYTASIYAARAKLEPLLLAGTNYGGQLMLTSELENFPGFPDGINGPEFMYKLNQQSEQFGTEIVPVNCISINTDVYPYIINRSDNIEIKTKSIIIATGSEALWLNKDGEQELKGKGISTCATCDGPFFKDVPVVVVGGGDSAMEEALFLTKFASKVIILHRRNIFRASKLMYERAKAHPKIEIRPFYIVKKWNKDSNNNLNSVLVCNVETEKEEEINCEGAFIAIGHKPNTKFIPKNIELDKNGYIIQKKNSMTNIEGIFACGDIVDSRYKQAITAAGSGCMASIDCEKWLENK